MRKVRGPLTTQEVLGNRNNNEQKIYIKPWIWYQISKGED
jgi:hypothetical protein